MMENRRSDFAAMLDDLIAEREPADAARPFATTLDYLSVAEQLTDRISIAEEAARASYLDAGEPVEMAPEAEIPEPPPPTDRQSVATELGLSPTMKPADLDRRRREFARLNHPDRVSERLRDCAIIRMQIANMLIDEAKARLFSTGYNRP